MNKKVFIMLVIFLMTAGYLNRNSLEAMKKVDLFNEIIQASKGETKEYGVRAVFKTEENGEEYCLKLLNNLSYEKSNTTVVKNEKIYSIEFNNNDINGYIESMSYDNYNVVTLNIIKKDSENHMSELVEYIKNAIGKDEKDVTYFQYLKAEINSNIDNYRLNEDIKELLKIHNASNIDTVKIENGYSTVAYTRQYPIMRSNGKYMDFNYAICSYTSGNYLIIGTPIIMTTY